ncbi:MAG TPA: ABC transporter substrate-binding protein [Candidatus Limnocylindrales bacterium]|jgi:osmoprotectant transport system substrate-binding protein|nr:ABC transporter substrate-binding protein [Candidatus Limnocylindrales bacterium]
MRTSRMLALGASLLALIGACGMGGGATPTAQVNIRIGSAGFYESALMAEIYAQVLEARGYTVTRNLQIGPRDTTLPAIERGDFDLMPEYIGSLLEFVNQSAGEATADSAQTHDRLQARLDGRGLTVLGYTPAQDKNTLVVRGDTAAELSLSRASDLAAVQAELVWGLPAECETNPLCGGVLRDVYGIDYDQIRLIELDACGAEIATALNGGAVDIGQLCSTQPDIARFGFVVLEDDRNTQPAENIAPIVRDDFLAQVGGADALAAILDPVSQAMTTDELTALNVRVGIEQEEFATVARDWLTEKGILPEGP